MRPARSAIDGVKRIHSVLEAPLDNKEVVHLPVARGGPGSTDDAVDQLEPTRPSELFRRVIPIATANPPAICQREDGRHLLQKIQIAWGHDANTVVEVGRDKKGNAA